MISTIVVSNPKKILVVSDNSLALALIGDRLVQAGYRVRRAESEHAAESWLAGGSRPDLAILDLSLPIDGALQLARRLNELDHVPFILLTALCEADRLEDSIPQLIPAIEAALTRARELQELRESRDHLQRALDNERNICVATGIVMMEYRLKRGAAYDLLRHTARNRQRKLSVVADEIVRARELLNLEAAQQPPLN